MARTTRTLADNEQLLLEILSSGPSFASQDDETQCRSILESLSEEEAEIAACTSYVYWLWRTVGKDTTVYRDNSALKEVRRHFIGEQRNSSNALSSVRESCSIRKERKIDMLRMCFDAELQKHVSSKEDKKFVESAERLIEEEMGRQTMVVRGKDKSDRAVVYRNARGSKDINEQGYYTATLYVADRAFACSEISTKGKEDQIVTVLDYINYESDKVPPLAFVRSSTKVLQRLFPERAKYVFVLDPPMWLQLAYTFVSPFMSKRIRDQVSV